MSDDTVTGDDRLVISRYEIWTSTHYYVKADGVEVHRVMSEADAARFNRWHSRSDPQYRSADYALRISPGETYHGFDSYGDAKDAGRAALADPVTGYEADWPRHIVRRNGEAWETVPVEDYYRARLDA